MLQDKLFSMSKTLILCYIDPSLGSMLIQVIISVIIGFAFFFRRIIGVAMAWFKKDSSKNKIY